MWANLNKHLTEEGGYVKHSGAALKLSSNLRAVFQMFV